jgi:hypothetical protein
MIIGIHKPLKWLGQPTLFFINTGINPGVSQTKTKLNKNASPHFSFNEGISGVIITKTGGSYG